jgi:hypothetical protein
MNGTWHYAEAERLLAAAEETPSEHDETNPAACLLLKQAEVHAGLANAAVAVLLAQVTAEASGHRSPELVAWQEATGGGTGPRGPSFSCGPGFPPLLRHLPRTGVSRFELMEGDRYE